jgi:glycosyltransferase involved in cell wall biosynthesis
MIGDKSQTWRTPAAEAGGPITLTLFVACYNEEENIEATLRTIDTACHLLDLSYEVIVVDDGSIDRSVEASLRYMDAHPESPIVLKKNERNEGVAMNFSEAAFLGRGEWYRMICGDNVEPEEALVTLFARIGEADILVPYHVGHTGRSVGRLGLSKFFTQLVNLISGYDLRYYNGMALMRRSLVMRWHSNSHGFGFQADLLTRLLSRGATYIEIGLPNRERQHGQSKALTFRNFVSVVHSLQNILIRRVSKALYGHC